MTHPSKPWQIQFSLDRIRRKVRRLDAEAADREPEVDRKRRERENREVHIPSPELPANE